jgi:hypothetical protein
LTRRAEIVLDCILLFALTAALIRPLFKAKYLDRWASIESTFVSDARYLAEHWPAPQWQPLWYGGTRFDYIYPPALRYGAAALVKTAGYIPVKAYHVYTAFFYCVGIAGAYLLIRIGSGSRGAAWLGATATALMSPCLLLLKDFRMDAVRRMPIRLTVLTRYGEGPHMTALALLPFALVFTWRAFDRRRPHDVALAAVFAAAVVSNNFYGATALALMYPLLAWSFWITRRERAMWAAAAAIPTLAYGLTAFWLTPSYLRITVENLRYVSERGSTWSMALGAAVAALYAFASARWAGRRRERTWVVFVSGCLLVFALNVLGNAYFNFRVTGEPLRHVPELDYAILMAAATLLAWVWRRGIAWERAAAALVVVFAFYTTAGYVRRAWQMYPPYPDYQKRVEYRVADWVARNLPDARTFTNGSVRFWFNAWRDLAQLGGGSEQGLLNGASMPASWDLSMGANPRSSIAWMQCYGVDLYYVSDKRSEETYKDVVYPNKFEGILEAVYDDGQGNRLFRTPRRWLQRARVVETAKLAACPAPQNNEDMAAIGCYADVMEKGPDSPVTVERPSPETIRLRARVAPGQEIVVQESYDAPWEATAGGRRLEVRRDVMGQMAIAAPPGEQEIWLRFTTPLEKTVGRWTSALAAAAAATLLALGFARRAQC